MNRTRRSSSRSMSTRSRCSRRPIRTPSGRPRITRDGRRCSSATTARDDGAGPRSHRRSARLDRRPAKERAPAQAQVKRVLQLALRGDRLVGCEGPAAQGHRHCRSARRGGAAPRSARTTSGRARRCSAGCSSGRPKNRPCSASTSASRRRSDREGRVSASANRTCQRRRANSGPMSTARCDDEDLGAASFLEIAHRRHFYFGIADGVKADFVRFRQCDARLNAQGGRKTASAYDAIGAAQVAKASFAGMRFLHHLDGKVAIWPMDPLPENGSAIVEIYTRIYLRRAGLTRRQAPEPGRAQPRPRRARQPARPPALRAQRPPDRRARHRRRHAPARQERAPRLRSGRPDARDRAKRRLDLRRAIIQRRARAGLAQW